jgi:hypothetical protein
MANKKVIIRLTKKMFVQLGLFNYLSIFKIYEGKKKSRLFGAPQTSISTLTSFTELEYAIEFIKQKQ